MSQDELTSSAVKDHQPYSDKMTRLNDEELDLGQPCLVSPRTSPPHSRTRRIVGKWEVHHVIGALFIGFSLLVIVFSPQLFAAKRTSPLCTTATIGPSTSHERRVDKGTVRLTMLGTGAMGLSGIGSAFGSSSVGQGIFGAIVTILSGIGLYTSDTGRATAFFGYSRRDAQDMGSLLSINGVYPHETDAWEYIHTLKDVKLNWVHHGRNAGGWVRFNADETMTWGTRLNYTVPATNEKRENGGCEDRGTCAGSSEADVIINTQPGDSAGEADEEWDSDDWNQLASSWVSQLQSAMADSGNYEIDNPSGVAVSGTFEVDQAS